MEARDLIPLYTPDEIRERVRSLAAEIDRDWRDGHPLFVCVLQGAVVFFADLIREVSVPIRCDFIQVSSYGEGTEPGGPVEIIRDVREEVSGRDVLLVEDIVDTGRTALALLDLLGRRGPKSLHLSALLDKEAGRRVEVPLRYRGFVVPDRFVVGYGLDLGGYYRNLPGLWTLPG